MQQIPHLVLSFNVKLYGTSKNHVPREPHQSHQSFPKNPAVESTGRLSFSFFFFSNIEGGQRKPNNGSNDLRVESLVSTLIHIVLRLKHSM